MKVLGIIIAVLVAACSPHKIHNIPYISTSPTPTVSPSPLPKISKRKRKHKKGNKTIKIAIIDTGLNLNDVRFKDHLCEKGHKSFVGPMEDNHGHGTHIAGIIQKEAGEGDYCFLIYKYYSDYSPGMTNLENEISSIKEAILNGATIINFSGGGNAMYMEEYNAIKAHPEVTVVAAAGNESINLDEETKYYPASYNAPNIISVGNLEENGIKVAHSSNYGKSVKAWEIGMNVISTLPDSNCVPNIRDSKLTEFLDKARKDAKLEGCVGYMSGSSMATAVHTGKLVRILLNKHDRGK